jgi:predicted DNA-binding protein
MSEPIQSFRLPEDLVARLEEAKWTLRKSKTDIVREALTTYLATVKLPKAKPAKSPKGQP